MLYMSLRVYASAHSFFSLSSVKSLIQAYQFLQVTEKVNRKQEFRNLIRTKTFEIMVSNARDFVQRNSGSDAFTERLAQYPVLFLPQGRSHTFEYIFMHNSSVPIEFKLILLTQSMDTGLDAISLFSRSGLEDRDQIDSMFAKLQLSL